MRTLAAVLLVVALAPAVSAQSFPMAVAGIDLGCEPVTALYHPSFEWVRSGAAPDVRDILGVAPAPRGRVYALIDVPSGSASDRFSIAEVRPDGGRIPLTAIIAGDPHGLVVDAAGAFHVPYSKPGSTTSWLLTFNAGGSLRSEINLGARYAFAPWNPAAGTAIDLASDQCTLFLIRLSSRATDPPSTIARYNVCNRAFLPDFPARPTRVNGLRLLPDGGLLVSADFARHVDRYAADGTFVRSYDIGGPLALMLADGGTRLLYGMTRSCTEGAIVTLNLATGATEGAVPLPTTNTPHTIAAANSWTAAIGNVHATEVPAIGTIALIVIAAMLAAAALVRLH